MAAQGSNSVTINCRRRDDVVLSELVSFYTQNSLISRKINIFKVVGFNVFFCLFFSCGFSQSYWMRCNTVNKSPLVKLRNGALKGKSIPFKFHQSTSKGRRIKKMDSPAWRSGAGAWPRRPAANGRKGLRPRGIPAASRDPCSRPPLVGGTCLWSPWYDVIAERFSQSEMRTKICSTSIWAASLWAHFNVAGTIVCRDLKIKDLFIC